MIACSEPHGNSETAVLDVEIQNAPQSSVHIAPVEASASSDAPRRGGVLMIEARSCGIPDPAIDSAIAFRSFETITIVNEIHARLTRIVEEPYIRVKPELAERFKVSQDGLLYEFQLRSDLKFSDGSPLMASDVKWSWERALRKATDTSRVNHVLGVIRGADAVLDGASSDLLGVEVIDDRQFRVMLSEPHAEFLMLLADPVASVLERENVAEWDDVWENGELDPTHEYRLTGLRPRSLPIGAGPFILTEYALPEDTDEGSYSNARCVIERNDYYWGRPAFLDAVAANVLPDLWTDPRNTMINQQRSLISGKIDLGIVWGDVGIDTVDDARTFAHVEMAQAPGMLAIALNPAHPPLDDVHFRRAIAKASNISSMRYAQGVTNLNRIVPPSIAFEDSTVEAMPYDREGAQHELNVSSYEDRLEQFDLWLSVDWTESMDDYRSVTSDSWRDLLGLDIEIREYEGSPLDEVHMTVIDFTANYPSPYGFLHAILEAFGDQNLTPELIDIGRMISEAAAEPDAAERQRRYEAIEQHMLDQTLAIPLQALVPHRDLWIQDWVHGLRYPKYHGSAFYDAWLNETTPERTLR